MSDSLLYGNRDTPWGGQFIQSGISIPNGGSFTTGIFYPGGVSSYFLIANVQAARNLSIFMHLFNPITLIELTDAVGVNVPIIILASFGPGLVSISFGPDGVEAQATMLAGFPFALQFVDNVGLGTTALSIAIYGFALMNRGAGQE
jgi:hypothetical protein